MDKIQGFLWYHRVKTDQIGSFSGPRLLVFRLKVHCRKKCPYSGLHFPELELNVERRSISPYSVRMREITDQNNSDYGHFSRSSTNQKKSPYLKGPTKNCFSQHVDEYSMLMFKSFILCNFWVSPYFIFVIIGQHEISSYFRVCSGFVQVFF